jgi:hypothetical protein
MKLCNIKGLKYPDYYFIQYFFKNHFYNIQNLTFLEFGCSNGNNLMLPIQYNHNIIGVDVNPNSISNAKENFSSIQTTSKYNFECNDMLLFAKNNVDIQADVFTLPNIINYISTIDFENMLQNVIKNNLVKKNSKFFIRCRGIKDFRFGIGTKVAHNTFVMPDDYDITGEAGSLNRFYNGDELVEILKRHLNLRNYHIFAIDEQNLQKDNITVLNSDIIIWGDIN